MATRAVFLPHGAEFPTANFPQLMQVNQRPVLAFDASTDETCYWTCIAPQGLTGTLTLVLSYIMASATTGAVGWQAQVEAVTEGDTVDLDATTSFDTANSVSDTVPGTAGYVGQVSITLTNADSLAAADYFRISVNRDANGSAVTDSATGDAYLLSAEFRDGA
jgi:hypothetical protein